MSEKMPAFSPSKNNEGQQQGNSGNTPHVQGVKKPKKGWMKALMGDELSEKLNEAVPEDNEVYVSETEDPVTEEGAEKEKSLLARMNELVPGENEGVVSGREEEETQGKADDAKKEHTREKKITQEESAERIQGACSFDELKALILENSIVLEGSEVAYTPQALVRIIEKIQNEEATLNYATRAGGFRAKLIELKEKEKHERVEPTSNEKRSPEYFADAIGEVESFDDLIASIKENDIALQGSTGVEHTPEDLVVIVQKIRDGRLPLEYATRSAHFRAKIQELVEKEGKQQTVGKKALEELEQEKKSKESKTIEEIQEKKKERSTKSAELLAKLNGATSNENEGAVSGTVEEGEVEKSGKEGNEIQEGWKGIRAKYKEYKKQVLDAREVYERKMREYRYEKQHSGFLARFMDTTALAEKHEKMLEAQDAYDNLLEGLRTQREERMKFFVQKRLKKNNKETSEDEDIIQYVGLHETFLERQIDNEATMLENLKYNESKEGESNNALVRFGKARWDWWRRQGKATRIGIGVAVGTALGGLTALPAVAARKVAGVYFGGMAVATVKNYGDSKVEAYEKDATQKQHEVFQKKSLKESREERKNIKRNVRWGKRASTLGAAGAAMTVGGGTAMAADSIGDALEHAGSWGPDEAHAGTLQEQQKGTQTKETPPQEPNAKEGEVATQDEQEEKPSQDKTSEHEGGETLLKEEEEKMAYWLAGKMGLDPESHITWKKEGGVITEITVKGETKIVPEEFLNEEQKIHRNFAPNASAVMSDAERQMDGTSPKVSAGAQEGVREVPVHHKGAVIESGAEDLTPYGGPSQEEISAKQEVETKQEPLVKQNMGTQSGVIESKFPERSDHIETIPEEKNEGDVLEKLHDKRQTIYQQKMEEAKATLEKMRESAEKNPSGLSEDIVAEKNPAQFSAEVKEGQYDNVMASEKNPSGPLEEQNAQGSAVAEKNPAESSLSAEDVPNEIEKHVSGKDNEADMPPSDTFGENETSSEGVVEEQQENDTLKDTSETHAENKVVAEKNEPDPEELDTENLYEGSEIQDLIKMLDESRDSAPKSEAVAFENPQENGSPQTFESEPEALKMEGVYEKGSSVEREIQQFLEGNDWIQEKYPELSHEDVGAIAHRIRLVFEDHPEVAEELKAQDGDLSKVLEGEKYSLYIDWPLLEHEIINHLSSHETTVGDAEAIEPESTEGVQKKVAPPEDLPTAESDTLDVPKKSVAEELDEKIRAEKEKVKFDTKTPEERTPEEVKTIQADKEKIEHDIEEPEVQEIRAEKEKVTVEPEVEKIEADTEKIKHVANEPEPETIQVDKEKVKHEIREPENNNGEESSQGEVQPEIQEILAEDKKVLKDIDSSVVDEPEVKTIEADKEKTVKASDADVVEGASEQKASEVSPVQNEAVSLEEGFDAVEKTLQEQGADYHGTQTRPHVEQFFDKGLFDESIMGKKSFIRSHWGPISHTRMADILDKEGSLTYSIGDNPPIKIGGEAEQLCGSIVSQLEKNLGSRVPNIDEVREMSVKENVTLGEFVTRIHDELEKAEGDTVTETSAVDSETVVEEIERQALENYERPNLVEEAGGKYTIPIQPIEVSEDIKKLVEEKYILKHPEWDEGSATDLYRDNVKFRNTVETQKVDLKIGVRGHNNHDKLLDTISVDLSQIEKMTPRELLEQLEQHEMKLGQLNTTESVVGT